MRSYNNLKPVDPPEEIINFKQMTEKNARVYGDKALYIYKESASVQPFTSAVLRASVLLLQATHTRIGW